MSAAVLFAAAILNHPAKSAESSGEIRLASTKDYTPQNITKTFTVYRTGGSIGAASVVCSTSDGTATAPALYTAIRTTLFWRNGDSSPKYCSVTMNDSKPYSGFKTFHVHLSSVTGASLGSIIETTVTLAGNQGGGKVTLSAPTYSVAQKAGKVVITVDRVDGRSTNAMVYYSTVSKTAVAGKDFTAAQGYLWWQPMDGTPKSFTVPIDAAAVFSGTKNFGVQIYGPHEADLGSTTTATVTITGGALPKPTPTPVRPTPTPVKPTTTVANTGGGFYVSGGKLYDANGVEFRIRGVDRTHYDSPSQPGISNSGANAVRMFLYTLGSGMAPKYANVLQTQHIDYGEVPIPVLSLFPDGTTASCNESTSELASGVAWWVANASTFTPLNRYMMINIANEWGPSNSATWASAYESAIASLRAAGYLGTLVIDAGGCGQDIADLLNYSTAVFNSDPQKNILFSLHIYGNIATGDVASDLAKLASLSQTAGMAFVVGEFGPGRDIGPSPTMTTPGQIITAAEANGIGWMGWAWDDNNLGGGASNNSWFSMTLRGPGYYTQASDLTEYGQDMVLNPTYGISVLAKAATIF